MLDFDTCQHRDDCQLFLIMPTLFTMSRCIHDACPSIYNLTLKHKNVSLSPNKSANITCITFLNCEIV